MSKITRVEAAIAYVHQEGADEARAIFDLYVTARGVVHDTVWTFPRLKPLTTVGSIIEFDFEATQQPTPADPITAIGTSTDLPKLLERPKVVRIYAASNYIDVEVVPGQPT